MAVLDRLRGAASPDVARVMSYQALFHRAKSARLPFDKEHWMNLAFSISNEQYVEWNDESNTIQRIPRHANMKHAPRPVVNKIQHFVLQEQAIVLQTRPTVDVLPASDDPGDISKANVANAYLTWLTDDNVANFDGELASAVMWALAGTEGYLKWTWSPRMKRGDITACSPTDVYTDPYPREFKNCRYVIHSQFMDVEQVYDIYGADLKPSDIDKADPVKMQLQREMGMAPVLQGVVVNELWMKPNRRHPQGIFAVWAHNQLLVDGPFPYDHGQLPFTQIGSVMRPGSQHYTSCVSALRAPQMELNKFHAQMIQIRENWSNPKWWLDSALELEADPDDSPNQILRGNSQGGLLEPKIIQPTQMPPNDAGKWIRDEMMDVVGLHEVSNAQVPGRVEAAKAIEMLKESDDGRLAEMLRTIKNSIAVGFYQQLCLARQFGTTEMMAMTYSKEGIPEVRRFRKESLQPGMRVNVTMGTGLARSRAARQDQLMLLWQNQIIQDKELMAELMDLPVSSVSPSNSFAIRLARNENYTMADGTPVTPNSWDNHDIHRREHNDYRMTQEFLELDEKHKSMFEFHVTMHDELQVQQLGKQLNIQRLAAAVASGAGFQTQQPGAAPGGDPGAPGPASPAGPGPPHPGTPGLPPPNAAGAAPPAGDLNDTPQGRAAYMLRDESHLAHPRV